MSQSLSNTSEMPIAFCTNQLPESGAHCTVPLPPSKLWPGECCLNEGPLLVLFVPWFYERIHDDDDDDDDDSLAKLLKETGKIRTFFCLLVWIK